MGLLTYVGELAFFSVSKPLLTKTKGITFLGDVSESD